ncbi:MAG: hypothetical protein J3K34DRAFT_294897 [Monoraphidium minutum]|nr:MAG: hypothetical protein J3K34DRAFT_294897 [Monoraphidium minutum]
MGDEEAASARPFTFDFFGGGGGRGGRGGGGRGNGFAAASGDGGGGGGGGGSGGGSSCSSESERGRAAEARAEAEAEAAADALIAGVGGGGAGGGAGACGGGGGAGGNTGEEGPGRWSYTEVAKELEGLAGPRPGGGAPRGHAGAAAAAGGEGAELAEVAVPGSDITLLKTAVSSGAAAALLGESQLQTSDLVPGKYEGGFKLWEGAIDLAAYLAARHALTAAAIEGRQPPDGCSLAGLCVLELGCGHGLPGILCLLAGSEVHFQDYNPEVLAALTAPNAAANLGRLPLGGTRRGVRYFAGDWLAVGSLLSSKGLDASYDLVLAAEAIYSPQGASRLLECIKQVLRPPHGTALIAAKTHYFGVGGGTAGFAAAVAADGALEVSRVWVCEDGVSNKREILQLAFPASIRPYFM